MTERSDDLVVITIFVQASPEARQKVLRRMLTQNPKVKIRLTEGQKRALQQRRASAPGPN